MFDLADVIAEKAEKDGRYAIAYAILELTEALKDLGFGRPGATYPGTTEKIAMVLGDIADALTPK